ncbi:MAG: hypothetical protein ACRDQZ_18670, partial [Mycobacteriales bacterium]
TGHTRLDCPRLERRADGRVYERQHPRPPRWRRPGRPRLWRFWDVQRDHECDGGNLGERHSYIIYIGRRGREQRSPLLVLAVHHLAHQAHGGWLEVTWFPSAHRAWAPSLAPRLKYHGARVRPFIGVRLAPGVSHRVTVGFVIGPDDPIWG